MATKKAKALTPAEIKTLTTELNKAMKENRAALKPYELAVKEATRAQQAAKKQADKLIADAQKAVDAATAKHAKAFDAAQKGAAKIQARLDALKSQETVK